MQNNTRTELFKYGVNGGVMEYHAMIHVTNTALAYTEQVAALMEAYDALLQVEAKGATTVFKRYFLSDAANQADYLMALEMESSDCALSIVEQSPLDGSKVALWVYLMTDVQTRALAAPEIDSIIPVPKSLSKNVETSLTRVVLKLWSKTASDSYIKFALDDE